MPVEPIPPTWSHGQVLRVLDSKGKTRQALAIDPVGDSSGWIVLGANEWIARTGRGDPTVRILVDLDSPRVVIAGVAVLAVDPAHDWFSEPMDAVRSPDLRAVPLGRIEEILNQRRLADLIRHVIEGGGIKTGLDLSPSTRPLPSVEPEITALRPTSSIDAKLADIDVRPRTDHFYRQLADLCGRLIAAGHDNYAHRIADANGVPGTTVHNWIKEARSRGYLAPSSRAAHNRRDP